MTLEVEHLIIFGLVYLAPAWLFGLEFKTPTFSFCDACFFELESIHGLWTSPKAALNLLGLETFSSRDDILFFVTRLIFEHRFPDCFPKLCLVEM